MQNWIEFLNIPRSSYISFVVLVPTPSITWRYDCGLDCGRLSFASSSSLSISPRTSSTSLGSRKRPSRPWSELFSSSNRSRNSTVSKHTRGKLTIKSPVHVQTEFVRDRRLSLKLIFFNWACRCTETSELIIFKKMIPFCFQKCLNITSLTSVSIPNRSRTFLSIAIVQSQVWRKRFAKSIIASARRSTSSS